MQSISVVGQTKSYWGQTFIRNTLYAIVQIPCSENTSEQGHEIIESIEKYYLETPPETLADTISLLTSVELPNHATLTIAIATKSTLHIASTGKGKAYILRDKFFSKLISGTGAITGKLKEYDKIVLTTDSFLQSIPEKELAACLFLPSLVSIEEEFSKRLHQSEISDGDACIVIENIIPEKTQISSQYSSPISRKRIKNILETSHQKKRLITVSVGTILTILLLSSIFIGNTKREKDRRKQILEQTMQEISAPLEEGKTLVTANPLKAKEQLTLVQNKIDQVLSTLPQNSQEYKTLSAVSEKTKKLIVQSEKKFEIKEPDIFLNLSWIRENAQGSRMSASDTTLFILDTINGAIYNTLLKKKNNDITASNTVFKKAKDIAGEEAIPYLISTEENAPIIDVDANTVISSLGEQSDPVAIESYAGNLYVLDKKQGILKLSKIKDGFSSPRSYLTSENTIDFSQVVDFAIDGSIWVITKDTLLKFTQGAPDPFFLKDDLLTSAKAIHTSFTSDFLYILEDNRVVLFTKEGAYQEQYIWDGFKDATDIISTSDTAIFVLKGKNIYKIERNIDYDNEKTS